jgi:uncharacterized protein with NAD-binding domain and iron-sulfur cluster
MAEKPKTKVVILGGGVGGLSAAHELIERDFDVEVYEAGAMWGGKARSLLWNTQDRKPDFDESDKQGRLPSEHGFRFFPAFYKHLPDTMKRIPIKDTTKTVFDNLVGATEVGIFRKDQTSIKLPGRYPTSTTEWEDAFYKVLHVRFHIADHEMKLFVEKLLVILTSCQDRRLAEYEKIDWWTFIEADRCSEEYKKFFGIGLTRSLVAMRAEVASARTVGNILLQLMLYMFVLDANDDRVLNAPTNDAWINPWIDYLTKKGVQLHLHAKTLALESDGEKITGVKMEIDGRETKVGADYYICAFPVEVMTRMLTPELIEAAPSLAHVPRLGTEWMNGIQFYLREKNPIVNGHVIYLDSKWALTSISQGQFWKEGTLAKYGDGKVKDVLSVDISNWSAEGSETTNLPAKKCTAQQIADEVWAQLKAHLNKAGKTVLKDEDKLHWFLDPDITFQPESPVANAEPLLVNTVNSWRNRPTATLKEIPNLMMASDYVQTKTDLATMEGANEAARTAVNEVLEQASSTQPRFRIWELEEPEMFAPFRDHDQLRFNQGLPHVPRGWVAVSLASGYHWGSVLSEKLSLPFLRAGWNTGESFALPVFRAGWNLGGAIADPILRAGLSIGEGIAAPLLRATQNIGGPIADPMLRAGLNTAAVMASLLRALAKKPPNS